MMMFFNRLILLTLLLAVSSTAFQTGLYQRRTFLAGSSSSSISWNTRTSFATKATPDDSSGGSTSDEKEKEVTDLDKATFQIAKEYAETGIPDNDSTRGPQIDGFSIFLGLYVVFVIVDTIFHITPEENYSTALANAIRGLIDGGN